MKNITGLSLVVILIFTVGCNMGPDSPRGFSLPEGNVEQGRANFLVLQCTACHTIHGVDDFLENEDREISVQLGGEISHIKTYGQLVTSIINPSHTLARGYKSEMRNYNDVMTVSQLIDLVAFLQSSYTLREVPFTAYPNYSITP